MYGGARTGQDMGWYRPYQALTSGHHVCGRETSESSPWQEAGGAPSLPPATAALCWPCDGAALSGGICCRSHHPPALLRSPVWSSAQEDKIHCEIRRAKGGRDALAGSYKASWQAKGNSRQAVSLPRLLRNANQATPVFLASLTLGPPEPAHRQSQDLGKLLSVCSVSPGSAAQPFCKPRLRQHRVPGRAGIPHWAARGAGGTPVPSPGCFPLPKALPFP